MSSGTSACPVSGGSCFVPEKGGFYPSISADVIFHKRIGFILTCQAVMTVMADNKLDAILCPHQQRLVVPIGEDQVDRNGVLSNGTGFPAIAFPLLVEHNQNIFRSLREC